jgi:hypothetical protein
VEFALRDLRHTRDWFDCARSKTEVRPPVEPKIKVDRKKFTVTLCGEDEVLKPQEIVFLDFLIKENGGWVSFEYMKMKDRELEGSRGARIFKRLPEKYRSLIESWPGVGYRLVLSRIGQNEPVTRP